MQYPLEIWTYNGNVGGDPLSRASLTIDNVGIYGSVSFLGTNYDIMPTSDQPAADPSEVVVTVSWQKVVDEPTLPYHVTVDDLGHLFDPLPQVPGTEATADFDGPAGIEANPGDEMAAGSGAGAGSGGSRGSGGGGGTYNNASDCHGTQPTGYSGYNALCIKPVADLRYRQAYSDYASRMTAALNAQASMWQSYSGVLLKLRSIHASTFNYSNDTDCYRHWGSFSSQYPQDSLAAGFQLFTYLGLSNCLGIASPHSTDCQIAYQPLTVITTKNSGAYNPHGSTTHLAKVSAHENGHIWGETGHPGDSNSAGKYNIMRSPWSTSVDFWETQATAAKVRNAARYGYCA